MMFLLEAGRNAAHFSRKNFWGDSTYDFSVRNRAKCCPFFSKKILGAIEFMMFLLEAGRNAAHFSRKKFWGDSIYDIFS